MTFHSLEIKGLLWQSWIGHQGDKHILSMRTGMHHKFKNLTSARKDRPLLTLSQTHSPHCP